MTTDAVLVNGLGELEQPAVARRALPPRICDSCQVGQSSDNCWLCGRRCRKIGQYVIQRALPSGGMAWEPAPTDIQPPDLLVAA